MYTREKDPDPDPIPFFFFKILTGKPTGKRPLGRPRHRRENIVRMDLKSIGVDMRNWVDLAKLLESPWSQIYGRR